MGVPFEIRKGGISAPLGQATCVPIELPSGRVWINKIVVAQTDGQAAFTVELFSVASACQDGGASESDDDGGKISDECFRVCPVKQGTGGLMQHFSEEANGGRGYSFVGEVSEDHRRVFSRILYLRIRPSGGPGSATYSVAVGGEVPMGD